MLKTIFALAVLVAAPVAAAEDVQAVIAQQIQEMNDAVGSGNAAVWDKYLDADVLYVEEDGSIRNKTDLVKEITPLPPGISGEIKVEVLQFHQDGDIATLVFRQHETENYFGQTLHALYLSTNTWRHRAAGWKMIAGQVLAENQDPPAIELPAARMKEYEGTYRLSDGTVTYTVVVMNRKLMGNRGDRPQAQLNAEATDVFFIAGQPRIRKIFIRDANGRITGFVDRREGRDVVWTKTK